MSASRTHHDQPKSDRSIPSLDGLRAISIVLVILAHSSWYLPAWFARNLLFRLAVGNGYHGVAVFFVISGFLITSLLIKEFDKESSISLKRFYFRRSLRIFPPFYFFLGVMAVLWVIKIIPEDLPSFISSLTYTWAYYPNAHGRFITHTWSLSIEEQFYLVWPLLFVLLHRKSTLIRVSLYAILAIPLVRVAFYFFLPSLRGHEFYMVQGWMDTIMVGCLLALIQNKQKWRDWRHRYLNGWVAGALFILAFLVNPYLQSNLPETSAGVFALCISPTLTALCIGGIMLYLIASRNSIVIGAFNNPIIRHIGLLSYSLYLWQQIFMSHELSLLPYGYLYMFAVAEFSLWLIEKPSLRLRAWLEAKNDR